MKKTGEIVGIVAGFVTILAFFGWPTLKSMFANDSEIELSPSTSSNDSMLIGRWKLNWVYTDQKHFDTLEYDFQKNGLGLYMSAHLAKRNDIDTCYWVIKCPFNWTTMRNKVLSIEYGLAAITYFSKNGDSIVITKSLVQGTADMITHSKKKFEYNVRGNDLYTDDSTLLYAWASGGRMVWKRQ